MSFCFVASSAWATAQGCGYAKCPVRFTTRCTAGSPGSSRRVLRQLRERLAQAVAAERFAEAASLRDELKAAEAALADDDQGLLCAANDAFYMAFEMGDVELMSQIWLDSDNVSCAHALSGLVVGYDQVISSWRKVFAMGRPTQMQVDEISINIRRNVAWIVCKQDIQSTRGKTAIGGLRIATNVFQKRRGEWKMVHHHASPVVAEDVQQQDSS